MAVTKRNQKDSTDAQPNTGICFNLLYGEIADVSDLFAQVVNELSTGHDIRESSARRARVLQRAIS